MWDWQKNKYKLLRRRRNCTLAAICKVGVPLVTVKAVTIIPPTLDGVVAISVLAACIVFSSDSFMARYFPNWPVKYCWDKIQILVKFTREVKMFTYREVPLCYESKATWLRRPGWCDHVDAANPEIKRCNICLEISPAATNAWASRRGKTSSDVITSITKRSTPGCICCTVVPSDISKYVTPNGYELIVSVGVTEMMSSIIWYIWWISLPWLVVKTATISNIIDAQFVSWYLQKLNFLGKKWKRRIGGHVACNLKISMKVTAFSHAKWIWNSNVPAFLWAARLGQRCPCFLWYKYKEDDCDKMNWY